MVATKHFTEGSDFPGKSQKELRIYSMAFCPYAERARLIAAAKNIPSEIININTSKKPDWYLKVNETGKVPAIEHNGKIVFDSMIIIDYLDEAFGGKKLNPADPLERAQNRMLTELFAKIPAAFYILFSKNLEGLNKQEWWDSVQTELQLLENELSKRGTTYFGGSEVKLIDYVFWPWFERFEAVPVLHPELKPLFPSDRFPQLSKYVELMKQDAAVKKESLPPQVHADFILSLVSGGSPAYDLGII